MEKFEFSKETELLFEELSKVGPENLEVCKETCRGNYRDCVNAGKDRDVCASTLQGCLDECYKNNLEALAIIKKIVASLT
ncbi:MULTISPECIES: hypothetical protein [Pedobacter]|uniref:hypothetical protein n=1 Tax=Pedobacter TaxID=84567 RepID=UPI001E2C7305|nr:MULTISPECIES: hypothetical protein [Pedobacter]